MIGLVTQDTQLFDDTVFANIAYGNKGATREEVIEAAKKAHAHDFITAKPDGYDTRMGDAGANFSGGEKQKIALARAILRDPKILILDEFTSAIDPPSEADIHEVLREFVKGGRSSSSRTSCTRSRSPTASWSWTRADRGRRHARRTRSARCPQYQRLVRPRRRTDGRVMTPSLRRLAPDRQAGPPSSSLHSAHAFAPPPSPRPPVFLPTRSPRAHQQPRGPGGAERPADARHRRVGAARPVRRPRRSAEAAGLLLAGRGARVAERRRGR